MIYWWCCEHRSRSSSEPVPSRSLPIICIAAVFITSHTASISYSVAGMYSFCQLMTAYMPTIIGRNITGIRPTHDCFYTNLDHLMTADWPTIGQIVWLQKVNLSLLFYQLYLTSWWYHCLHTNSSWIIYVLWTHLPISNHLAGLLDTTIQMATLHLTKTHFYLITSWTRKFMVNRFLCR